MIKIKSVTSPLQFRGDIVSNECNGAITVHQAQQGFNTVDTDYHREQQHLSKQGQNTQITVNYQEILMEYPQGSGE